MVSYNSFSIVPIQFFIHMVKVFYQFSNLTLHLKSLFFTYFVTHSSLDAWFDIRSIFPIVFLPLVFIHLIWIFTLFTFFYVICHRYIPFIQKHNFFLELRNFLFTSFYWTWHACVCDSSYILLFFILFSWKFNRANLIRRTTSAIYET